MTENLTRKIRAADYLRVIYDSMGQENKADECMRFLAAHKKMEGENKALVSQLEGLFQSYLSQKQKQQAAQEKKEAVKKTVKILVPIALLVAALLVLAIRRRGKRHLETARQAHRMEQAALSGRLKRSNQELRELKDKIQQNENASPRPEAQAASFSEEPICRLIMERVNDGQFKSKVDYIYYKEYALDKQQLLALRRAADRHFGQFTVRLKKAYPDLTNSDLDYCCLYLLGLTDADIAALMQRAYNTVIERNGKLRKIFDSDNTLFVTLSTLASGTLSV